MPAVQTNLTRACACGACVRRGCLSICPDGQLVAGKGTRFILTNTQELHDKIGFLEARIKDLEAALAELQSKVSSTPHPLLAESLKTATDGLRPDGDVLKDFTSEEEELLDTFGSLTIDPKGETIWYGPTADSDFLMPRKQNPLTTEPNFELPVDIFLLSKQFPFKNAHEAEDTIRKYIRSSLPPKEVAFESILSLHSQLSWVIPSIVGEDLRRTILEPIYSVEGAANDQQVAVLFITMALFVLIDQNRPMYHPDAHRYYHLSRASMSLGEDIFQSHSMFAIQYLHILAHFNSIINDPQGPNRAWGAIGLAIRLAQMAGLHRDNEQWDRYPEQAERRRLIWWDLIAFETFFGFAMGRPRAIYPADYDTKMPEDDEDKGKPPSFNRLRYRFISEFLGGVLDEAFAAKAPPYSTILKLDKNLRDSDLRCGSIDMSATEDGTAIRKLLQFLVQPLSTTAMREIALMYLHRRYFVEALARQPREPLRSKYAMSVLAVHRSSVLLLQGILGLDRIVEEFLTRLSFIWIHALSAYVCLCAIVIKSPGSRLARSSLTEIDRIKSSFARATTYRVFHAQPTIDKLYQQAHLAMNQYRKGKWPPTKPDEEIDAGVMKLIGRAGFAPEKPQEAITPTSESDHSENHQSNGIHPDLFEYMKQFENQSEKNGGSTSTYPTQMSTLNFLPEQRIFPSLIPGFRTNNGIHGSQPPGRSTNGFDTVHLADPHPNHSNFTHPPFHPTDWPSNHIYGGPPVGMNSTGGYAPPISSQPFLYGDPFLEQGMGPLHPGQQQPQDQVWEQFLSTLMPNESSQNPT